MSWDPPQLIDPDLKSRTFEDDVAYLRLKDGLVSSIGMYVKDFLFGFVLYPVYSRGNQKSVKTLSSLLFLFYFCDFVNDTTRLVNEVLSPVCFKVSLSETLKCVFVLILKK